MSQLSEGMRRFFLAGVGALASTGEKSKEIIDDLVEKGELTVEEGKELNQELKYDFDKSTSNIKEDIIYKQFQQLSEEEQEKLLKRLTKDDKEPADYAEDANIPGTTNNE